MLPSTADGEGQGQLSPLPQMVRGQGEKAYCPCHHMADKVCRFSTPHDLIADSPMPPTVRSALLCCPGEVYYLLFQVLQPERGKVRSPVFMLSGLALPPTTGGEERKRGKGICPLVHAPLWQMTGRVRSPTLTLLGSLTCAPVNGFSFSAVQRRFRAFSL